MEGGCPSLTGTCDSEDKGKKKKKREKKRQKKSKNFSKKKMKKVWGVDQGEQSCDIRVEKGVAVELDKDRERQNTKERD